ncbi:unnamed protein product [Victoria cruziana]
MQKQNLLLLLGWLLFLAPPAAAYGKGKYPLRPPALIVFGDSIVDAGNNNHLMTVAKCNYPPYGRDFKGKVPTGRFSNGKTVSDIGASLAEITDNIMAYLDPNLEDGDLLHGVTFASGGAGLDDLTSNTINAISLSSQVDLFKEYITRLRRVAGERKANDIIANINYDIDSYTSFLVSKLADFTEAIYDLGARRIAVAGLPALGCVPFVRTISGGPFRECVTPYNEASVMFNNKLQKKFQSLRNTLDGSLLLYLDIYNPLMELIQNPNKYGFEETTRGCCGSGTVEAVYMCNALNPLTCTDSNKYVFWDSFHPTEKAYRLLLNHTLAAVLPLLQ